MLDSRVTRSPREPSASLIFPPSIFDVNRGGRRAAGVVEADMAINPIFNRKHNRATVIPIMEIGFFFFSNFLEFYGKCYNREKKNTCTARESNPGRKDGSLA